VRWDMTKNKIEIVKTLAGEVINEKKGTFATRVISLTSLKNVKKPLKEFVLKR
jgi:hypothetical protein